MPVIFQEGVVMSGTHEHGGNVFGIARSLGVPPEQILDFSASINPLGMAPGVGRALLDNLDRLLHYPDKDSSELKEALAAYHRVGPDQIAVANGSTEIIHLLPRAFGGRRALIVAPAFAEYAAALARCGWEIDYFTLQSEDGFALSLPALMEKLSGRYDLLFLCNPANPTGGLIPKPEIARVLALCQGCGTFLVLDEAFIDFCEEESAKELIASAERAVLLRSMTKFFAIPGLRLGYAIGAPATVAAIAALQDPWSVNTAAQLAGIASLADAEYGRRTREYVEAERERLAGRLARIPGFKVFPSRANYLLVQLCNGAGVAELRAELLKRGVLIRDCSNFVGLDGGFFRVAVRLREENDRLLELLEKRG
jgi:threonine-phosphate decarboxylase